MWNTNMYPYEIEGSCLFKLRPKLLSLKNGLIPGKIFFQNLEQKKLEIELKMTTYIFREEQKNKHFIYSESQSLTC